MLKEFTRATSLDGGTAKNPTPDTVLGENVTICGFEEFSFFAYESNEFLSAGWYVCEGSTGFAVGPPQETKQLAIHRAREILTAVGKEKLLSTIEKIEKAALS